MKQSKLARRLFRARWKPWNFGPMAKSLPVARDPAAWPNAAGSRRLLHEGSILRRHPSGAVPETVKALLDRPGRFLVPRRRSWDLLKYSRLYTGESYTTGPTFEFVARNCWLHVPSGFVISENREVLAFSSYSLPSLYEGHSAFPLDDAPWIEKPSFKLCSAWGNNYAHWLMDALPKADVLSPGDSRSIVADKPSPQFQNQSLSLLGLSEVIDPATELLRFRELHFVSTGRSGVPDPGPLLRVRDRLRDASGPAEGPRRIYLSRQRTRRRIINGEAVARVLADFGFEEVFSEELDFAAQVRLFSGAEAVFGAHGAGTLNVLFVPEGAALIEAFNPRVWDHAAHRVASLCGVRHFHIFAENASRQFDTIVDPSLLAKTLALALGDADRSTSLLVEKLF